MKSQLLTEAEKRVQFVAAVYDYQSAHRESPLGIWMPQTRHWVGDIFDTKLGRIYVPLTNKGIFDPYVYDATAGVHTVDPRLVEYDFQYSCFVHKAVPIEEPQADPSNDCDRNSLPNSFFKLGDHWFHMRAYPMTNNELAEDKPLQDDITIVRQIGDLSNYSPLENGGFLNLLSDKGLKLPPIIPVSSYWVYSDGLMGEGYMLKTSSGWREVYVWKSYSGDNSGSYTSISRECCILSRKKGMEEGRIAKGALLPYKDIKTLWSYVLETEILPFLGHEPEIDTKISIHCEQSPEEEFRIAGFMMMRNGTTSLVVGEKKLDQINNWPNKHAILFPVEVIETNGSPKNIKIHASKGNYATSDIRGRTITIEGGVDPKRCIGFLKENIEKPIIPEFRNSNQLRVEVAL